MGIFLWIALITAAAGVGGTGLGGVVAACFRRDSDKTVSLLLSFASGVMLSVVCFDLIQNAITPEGCEESMDLWPVLLGILLGFLVIALLNLLIDRQTNREVHHIDEDHPQTADALDELIHYDHYESHKEDRNSRKGELFIAGVVMACAIALHNLPEGVVIGAAYAADSGSIDISGSGFIMAVVIGLHNIPEGMAVSVPLISGGMSRWKAIVVTALSGAPTVVGALLGYSLGMLGPVALCLSLSFASGAMLYVVFGELLPESILMWRSKLPALAAIVGILVGILIIFQ